MLDNVVRFVGQRVAAVVADSEAAAEEGCRKLEVEYEMLPAVFDPEEAMAPAPRSCTGRRNPHPHPEHNILLELHGGMGDIEAGFDAGRRRPRGRPTSPPAPSTRTWKRIARSPGWMETA